MNLEVGRDPSAGHAVYRWMGSRRYEKGSAVRCTGQIGRSPGYGRVVQQAIHRLEDRACSRKDEADGSWKGQGQGVFKIRIVNQDGTVATWGMTCRGKLSGLYDIRKHRAMGIKVLSFPL